MKRYVYTLDLKDDPAGIAEYREHHRAVWPEVIESLNRIGVRGNRIYALGRRLVMILEVDDAFDPERDLVRYAEDARAREWDELMREFQEPAPGAKLGEWWALMEPVFDLHEAWGAVRTEAEGAPTPAQGQQPEGTR